MESPPEAEQSPVLSFVVSLRAPQTTTDYGAVESDLRRTLDSLRSQTNQRFEVIVVSNIGFEYTCREFSVRNYVVDFPIPEHAAVLGDEHIRGFRLDKGSKLGVALSHISTGHIMTLDADDFVSRRMTEFVSAHPDEPGWYVDRGIVYDTRTGLSRKTAGFNQICGTSLVYRRDVFPDVTLPDSPAQQDVLDSLGEERVLHDLGSHVSFAGRHQLAPLPFVGAVYSVNTGHNDSQRGALRLGRPLSRAASSEFGIERLPAGAMWRHAVSGAPRGVAGAIRRGVRSR